MLLPVKTSHHYQTLDSVLKTYKEWKFLANLTSDRAITKSRSKRAMNGKEHSKYAMDFLN